MNIAFSAVTESDVVAFPAVTESEFVAFSAVTDSEFEMQREFALQLLGMFTIDPELVRVGVIAYYGTSYVSKTRRKV